MGKNSELMGPGVYIIYCHTNKKAYIGSSNKVNLRLNHHRCDLRADKHGNQHLQNAWNLYGESSFSMGLLHPCLLGEQVGLEQHYLDIWIAAGLSFNRRPRADSPTGMKWTDAERKAKSVSMKNRPSFGGRHHTESSKTLLSERAKDRYADPENNPFFGKSHSEETKAKISEKNTGNKYCVGRKCSDRCKQAVIESNKRRAGEKRQRKAA